MDDSGGRSWDDAEMPDDVTNGELARRMNKLESQQERGFITLGRQIENLKFVSRETYTVQIAALVAELATLRADLAEQKEDSKWTRKTAIGQLIYPAIVALLLWLVTKQ